MFAASTTRVSDHTSDTVNQSIEEQTRCFIEYYEQHPEEIDDRLKELDREWDVERALETGSAGLSLAGLSLGIAHNRRWLLLPLAVQTFFLQHALQGWCPPLPLLRRMGFRTEHEIDIERNALKAIRGDFSHVPTSRRGHSRAREAYVAAVRGSPNGSSPAQSRKRGARETNRL